MTAVMAPSLDGGIVQVGTMTVTDAEPSTFWQDKTVIVTGGAGFVGSHLVDLLSAAGADVTVIDNLSRGRPVTVEKGVVAIGMPMDVKSSYNFVYGDVADEGTCRDNFKVSKQTVTTRETSTTITDGPQPVDIIFNLAAHVAGVIYNQSHHTEMFSENLQVLSTPLKIAAEYGVGRFLQTSTVCVYSLDHNHPCVEPHGHDGHPTPANEGYSWAKRIGEHLARWTASSTDLHTVIVRPSNIYGPRDWFDDRAHVVPRLVKKVFENPSVELYLGGTKREFIYVTDVARGMMAAIEHGVSGEVYNIGTGGRTVATSHDLVAMIQAAAGTCKDVHFIKPDHDQGDLTRWSDSSKLEKLGWRAVIDLEEGLNATVKWYEERQ